MNLLVDGSFLSISGAAWAGFFLDLFFKSLLLLAIAHAVTRFFRWWPAALRSRVWTLVFCVLLLLPLVTVLLPQIKLAGLKSTVVSVVQVDSAADTNLEPGAARPATDNRGVEVLFTSALENGGTVVDSSLPGASNQLSLRYWPAAMILWLFGTAWCAARTMRSYYVGLSAAKSARRLSSKLFDGVKRDFGICHPVELRVSEEAPAPFVTGITAQYVVLPAALVSWDENELRAVFHHELAHVRRRDLLRLIMYDLVHAIYWFNPLARTAVKRAALDVEMACDDVVCSKVGAAASYARRLLWFARRLSNARQPVRTPGMPGRSGVEQRIKYILNPKTLSSNRRTPVTKPAVYYMPALLAAVLLVVTTAQVVEINGAAHVVAAETAAVSAGQSKRETPPPLLTSDKLRSDLFKATSAGDLDTVTGILDENLDYLNAKTQRGMTPLALAAWNDHLEVVEYLINRGADPDVKNHNGLTPLFCAVDRGRHAMARLLVRGGADLTTRGYRGRTLLHMAARSGDAGLAHTLIERGAGVNATDAHGATPLDLAAWHRKQSVAVLLAGKGAARSTTTPPTPIGRKNRKSTA